MKENSDVALRIKPMIDCRSSTGRAVRRGWPSGGVIDVGVIGKKLPEDGEKIWEILIGRYLEDKAGRR